MKTNRHHCWSLHLNTGAHSPLRLQRSGEVVFGEDNILGDTADAISTVADCTELSRRHSAAVTSDTSCIAHTVGVSELLRWRKI